MRIRGFTLVEVLIAVAIVAIMAAMGYAGINQAMRERVAVEAAQQRLIDVQRAMRILSQDFAQVVPRPARDPEGGGDLQPAIASARTPGTLVTLTRGGWSNPIGAQRQTQQRVRYRFGDGMLYREHWLAVDAALNAEPRARVVLDRVKSVTMRYMDPTSRVWRNDWPAISGSGVATATTVDLLLRARPAAVEVIVELEDWGTVSRIFEVAT
jgi:general secretion pathway protein J